RRRDGDTSPVRPPPAQPLRNRAAAARPPSFTPTRPRSRPAPIEEFSSMTRASKLLSVAFVALLGLWGCAQGPTGTAQAERLKALEAKNARLEEDFRAAAGTRDQLRQQLAKAEEHLAKLQTVVR